MPRRATLAARIARLERRQQRPDLPRFIVGIFNRCDETDIIGYRAGELVAMRTLDEPLQALKERAWALGASPILVALYRPREAQEREGDVSGSVTAPDTATAFSAAPSEPEDPFDRAGIGRRATADELWFAGWTRGPAERPR